MQIRVLFFGVLRDVVGRSAEMMDAPEGARVQEVLTRYTQKFPRIAEMLPSTAVSVNREYSGTDRVLQSGDEIALLPPVSGGSTVIESRREPVVKIVRERIATADILEQMKVPEDGAAIVFEGVVRNNTRGRRTLYLDYEAYEAMALRQMQELIERAEKQFKIREAAIVHRLGRLEIGETSVLIVVASAHRSAAFDACRWMIDTLKKTVPIWKKEYFEDGAVWADGDAFPEDIPRAGGTAGIQPASK